MARLGSTTTARAQQMRGVLRRWERSGLTLKEFGRRQGLPATTLVWWRHVFRHAERPQRVPRVASAPTGSRGGASKFVEVGRAALPLSRPCVIEVVLRSGHVLRVPVGVEASAVRVVVSALEAAC